MSTFDEIPTSDLEIGALLGRGSFGEVHQAKWLGTPVAVKTLVSISNTPSFLEELKIMSSLRHPNVASFLGACTKKQPFRIVIQLYPDGNLAQLIESRRISTSQALDICTQIARGMVYLHSKNIIHRDLKPENILIEQIHASHSYKVFISDFGLAVCKQPGSQASTLCGTPRYIAPEVYEQSYHKESDVFSFSVLIHELFTGKKPWGHMTFAQIMRNVLSGNRPIEALTASEERAYPQEIRNLVVRCWQQDPRNRPSFREIFDVLTEISAGFVSSSTTTASPLREIQKSAQQTADGGGLQGTIGAAEVAAAAASGGGGAESKKKNDEFLFSNLLNFHVQSSGSKSASPPLLPQLPQYRRTVGGVGGGGASPPPLLGLADYTKPQSFTALPISSSHKVASDLARLSVDAPKKSNSDNSLSSHLLSSTSSTSNSTQRSVGIPSVGIGGGGGGAGGMFGRSPVLSEGGGIHFPSHLCQNVGESIGSISSSTSLKEDGDRSLVWEVLPEDSSPSVVGGTTTAVGGTPDSLAPPCGGGSGVGGLGIKDLRRSPVPSSAAMGSVRRPPEIEEPLPFPACLITRKELALLCSWANIPLPNPSTLPTTPRVELIYHAVRDGFSNEIFHKQCDKKGRTFTVIRTKTGFLFGGFASIPWESLGGWAEDKNAFLFRLRVGSFGESSLWPSVATGKNEPVRLGQKVTGGGIREKALFFHSMYGPKFGDGDLFLDLNSIPSSSSLLGNQYESPGDPALARRFLAGSFTNWFVDDVQVFLIH